MGVIRVGKTAPALGGVRWRRSMAAFDAG